jgi:hypothetical protein
LDIRGAKVLRYAAALCLVALTWSLYNGVVHLWWMYDDLFHIHFLSTHRPLAYCFSPSVWRGLPFKMFTPAQFLSYQADLALFGPSPAPFYWHLLLVFAAAVVAVFAVLALWLPLATAFLGAVLFVLGAPTVVWVQQLTLRHYSEGLLWSAAAVWLFTKAVREDRASLSLASAAFYLAAMLDKEVYVPLVGLLLALPEGSLRQRARMARPHFVMLATYLAWRFVMLGTLLGGYGWAVRPSELPRLALELPGEIVRTFLGPHDATNGVVLLALSVGIAAAILRSHRAAPLLFGSLAAVALPALAVAKSVGPRFGVLAWLALIATFAFGCDALLHGGRGGRIGARILATAAVVGCCVVNREVWSSTFSDAQRMSTEGMRFIDMDKGELLRHPRIPPATMNEIRWFKEEYLHRAAGAGWFDDDFYVCAGARDIRAIWEWQDSTRSMADVTQMLPSIRSGYCTGLREAPLSAVFWRKGQDIFWDLGPYQEGRYAFVLGEGQESIAVPPHAGYRDRAAAFALRVRYEAPSGWVTYSPELRLDFQRSPRWRWAR